MAGFSYALTIERKGEGAQQQVLAGTRAAAVLGPDLSQLQEHLRGTVLAQLMLMGSSVMISWLII